MLNTADIGPDAPAALARLAPSEHAPGGSTPIPGGGYDSQLANDVPLEALLEQTLLEVDPSLTPLEACVRYSLSEVPLQSTAFLRSMPEVAASSGYKRTYPRLKVILEMVMDRDQPEVRQVAVAQLAPLGRAWYNDVGSQAEEALKELLMVAVTAVKDPLPDVREAVFNSLADLAALVTEAGSITVVLKLLNVLEQAVKADTRSCIGRIAVSVAGHLNTQQCAEHVLPIIQQIAGDTAFSIRTTAASCLVHVAPRLYPLAIVDLVMPIYNTLATDKVWAVRQATAKELTPLAKLLLPQARVSLVPILQSWLNDRSHWVKDAALEQLGPMLCLLPTTPDLHQDLLDKFAKLPEQPQHENVFLSAAQSLVPLARHLGRARWDLLRHMVGALVDNEQTAVREVMAEELPFLAEFVGQEEAESHLLPYVSQFAADEAPEVRLATAHGTRDFLAGVPYDSRSQAVDALREVGTDPAGPQGEKWRFRESIARQLADVADLCDLKTIASVVIPCALRLCRDPVAAVRATAAESTADMVVNLEKLIDQGHGADAEDLAVFLHQNIHQLRTSATYNERQVFVMICEGVLEHSAALPATSASFMEAMAQLAYDSVANVRLSVAQSLSQLLKQCHLTATLMQLARNVLAHLREDKDRDVRAVAASAYETLVVSEQTACHPSGGHAVRGQCYGCVTDVPKATVEHSAHADRQNVPETAENSTKLPVEASVGRVASPFALSNEADVLPPPPTFLATDPSPAVVVAVVLSHHHPEGLQHVDTKAAVLWHHLVHCTIDATLIRLGGCWKMWSGSPDLLLIAVGGAFGNRRQLLRPDDCAQHSLTIIAQLQQSLGRVVSPGGRHLTAEYSVATGEVVAGVIGVRPPTFQVMGCVVEKARTLSIFKGLAEVKVTEAVAMLLDLPRSETNLLGTAPFEDFLLKMYEVGQETLAARQLPTNRPTTPFEKYCDDAVRSDHLQLANGEATSSEEAKVGGQHDSLLTWLPCSRNNSLNLSNSSPAADLRVNSEPSSIGSTVRLTVQGPFLRSRRPWPGTDARPDAVASVGQPAGSNKVAKGPRGSHERDTRAPFAGALGRPWHVVDNSRPQALSPEAHSNLYETHGSGYQSTSGPFAPQNITSLTGPIYGIVGTVLLRFSDTASEAEFSMWANQFMARVDLIGAFLSVLILLVAGLKESIAIRDLALLIVVPCIMLYIILSHHKWFVSNRNLVIAVEQLAVLWPILYIWHPQLLGSMAPRALMTPIALFRFAGVELLVKHTINHARFRYQAILHLITFLVVAKVCPPRVCAAVTGAADPMLCQDLITYGWQFSLGLLSTLAGVYTWESMLRIYFVTHRAQLSAAGPAMYH